MPSTPPWHTISLRFVGGHELHVVTTDPTLRDVLHQSLDGSLGGRDTVTVLVGDAFPLDGGTAYAEALTDLHADLHDVLHADHTPSDDVDEDDACQCPACRAQRDQRIH